MSAADRPDFPRGVALLVAATLYLEVLDGNYTVAFTDVHAADLSDANTVHASAQELLAGIGIGCAVVAVSIGSALDGPLSLPAGAFGAAFVLLAVLLGVCVVGAIRLPRDAAGRVTGHVGV